ncbi:PIG-L deacetylase family protein [Micromonospora sp. WMMD737]|uniref:PIG-L deacetylase family protein n=1 Tax=Micromonospora sp. WMMD737 TaxID=3404113 RepID=UPI003B93A708
MSFPASPPALSGVGRALAVFAHPDDADFGCAGTIATWPAEGVDASYLLVDRATPESAATPARRCRSAVATGSRPTPGGVHRPARGRTTPAPAPRGAVPGPGPLERASIRP